RTTVLSLSSHWSSNPAKTVARVCWCRGFVALVRQRPAHRRHCQAARATRGRAFHAAGCRGLDARVQQRRVRGQPRADVPRRPRARGPHPRARVMADSLPTRGEDFNEWYNQLVLRADLADYAPVRGCMIVKPYGWALWENIQAAL